MESHPKRGRCERNPTHDARDLGEEDRCFRAGRCKVPSCFQTRDEDDARHVLGELAKGRKGSSGLAQRRQVTPSFPCSELVQSPDSLALPPARILFS